MQWGDYSVITWVRGVSAGNTVTGTPLGARGEWSLLTFSKLDDGTRVIGLQSLSVVQD